MITSATGLKANVRNISHGDDRVAKAYLRIFFMERFMERVSLSDYKDNFILKGGMLVSSLLGIDVRATMDIDTTIKALPLNSGEIEKIIHKICLKEIDDNVSFSITRIETIMDDFEYPGVRVHMEGYLDKLRQPLKIDVSTDDVITPSAIDYKYKLLFEDRTIDLLSYNIETMLAEKIQTIIHRGLANTRMRDFYDVYELINHVEYSIELLREAFEATCKKRETLFSKEKIDEEIANIKSSNLLRERWNLFKDKNFFIEELEYEVVITEIESMMIKIMY